jgi:hypothetical protein
VSPSGGAARQLPRGGLWGERTGRVVDVDEGILVVSFRSGTARVTWGGALLARVAADQSSAPRPGDRVLVRGWADGNLTAERVVARPVP